MYCSPAYFSMAYGDSGLINDSTCLGRESVFPYIAAEEAKINFLRFELNFCLLLKYLMFL